MLHSSYFVGTLEPGTLFELVKSFGFKEFT